MIRKMYIVFDDSDGWLDIDSNEFGISYSSTDTGYGLQCNYEDENDPDRIKYYQVKEMMDKMREILLNLIAVNAKPFEEGVE